MAHSRSAVKRIRQNLRRKLGNRAAKSALRTAIKKFRAAVSTGDLDAAAATYHLVQEKVDKTASKGIIHKGTAARIKSRLSQHLNALKTAKASA